MAMYDDLAVLLRNANRSGLRCLTLNKRDGVWRAYSELPGVTGKGPVTNGHKSDDSDPVEAAIRVLQPYARTKPSTHRERIGELEDALNELIEVLFHLTRQVSP